MDSKVNPALSYPPDALLDAAEALFLVNHNGVIRFMTPAAAHYYQYAQDDLIGRSVLRFVVPEEIDAVRARWQAFVDNPKKTFDELTITTISATGYRMPVTATIWRLPNRHEFLVIHRMSERFRNRLETLYTVLKTVSSTLSLEDCLDIVLREAMRLIPADSGTIYMLQANNKLHLVNAQGHMIESFALELREPESEFKTAHHLRESGKPLIIDNCEDDPLWTILPGSEGIKSWLGVPLYHQGEFVGILNLDSQFPHAFNREDADLAQALASQVAAALYNARQYELEHRRAERLQALGDVGQAIRQLDLDSVLEVVYQKISSLMQIDTFFIGLHEPETHVIRRVGTYENGQRVPDLVMRDNQDLSGQVLRTRQNVIIHDSNIEKTPPELIVEGEMPCSVIMMPLITPEGVVGVISVQSYEPNAYTADDIALLETIAGSVATAVRNAQLYDNVSQQLAALSTLHQMGLEMATAHDPDTIIQLTITSALTLFHSSQVRLYLNQTGTWPTQMWRGHETGIRGQSRIRASEHLELDSVTRQVEQSQQPVVITDLNEQPDLQTEYDMPWLVQSLVSYPVRYGEQSFGVLTLLHSEPQAYDRDMLRTIELVTMQAADAFENARHTITLHRRLEEVSALQNMARDVSSRQSLDEILHITVRALQDVYHCKSVSLALYNSETEEVITQAAVGLEAQYIEQGRFKLGEFVAGEVVATGQMIYVPDTHSDDRFRLIDPDVRSMLTVPLTIHDRIIGTLSIDSKTPDAFTPDHERVLTIAGGQIAAIIETIRLLEETRQRAAELANANAELKALHELRTELVQNVSHELRGPLGLIRGYAGLLLDESLGELNPKQKDAMTIIDEKGAAITRMVNDILSLEQIQPGTLQRETLDISQLANQVIEGIRLVYKDRDITFYGELAAEPYLVNGDPVRLNQIFDNLISNAVKFSPDGGDIIIRSQPNPSNNTIRFSIIDHGIGIPADRLPHIFERFYQGAPSIQHQYGGTGLGLAIVKRVVEAHGGTLEVISQEGKGSTFTFELPLIER
ncbi:MAG: GAF domain-containing protein [Anaerolineae bacterium]|nr:GAF domain-containing protein [Anaerolineae bacterium]